MDAPPQIEVGLLDIRRRTDACVVDQNIQTSVLLAQRLNRLFPLGLAGHIKIAVGSISHLSGGFLAKLRLDISQDHPRTVLRQPARDFAPDSLRSSGDERHLAFKR